ncbi:MAG TPA: DUF4349 domain-containing protein [Acidimicrobiales bacterium]|nr:DUF4349 domain-containing protein [Acidimicrobiales bacterium]
MTVIEEDRLRRALGEAADAFDVPTGAQDRVLAAARTATTDAPRASLGALIPHSRRVRAAAIAAAVVLVAGGVTLFHPGTSPSSRPSAASTAGSAIGSPPPSAGVGQAPTTGGSTGAPSGSGSTASPRSPASRSAASPAPAPGTGTPTTPTSIAPLPPGAVGQSPKVVTTGSVELTIGNGSIQSVVTRLTTVVVGDGGFVAKSQVQVGSPVTGTSSSGNVVLQVPQASFGTLVTQVQGIGKVESSTSTSTDVTGQYVDLQSRITALQASRQQYLTILSRATSIGDILAVQSQLDSLQSQIEQLQGQLDVLNSQTTYGTLTVSLAEAGHHPPPPPSPRSGLSAAWHDSVSGFVSGFEWLIRIAGPVLFAVLFVSALAAAGRVAWRAYRRRTL